MITIGTQEMGSERRGPGARAFQSFFNDSIETDMLAITLDPSTVQLLLLFVELLLLVATLSLLIINRKETRARETLMRHFSTVADVITRQEYFVAVIDAIQRAEKQILGSITGSSPSSEEGEVVQQILETISDASKHGVAVRYLLPMSPDRLRMGRRYRVSGAEVKFHPSLLISDMRYMCVDGKLVLIGVPEKMGRNEPTRKGFTIPSESVTHLFVTQFENQWNSKESKDYSAYLQELVTQARASNPDISMELMVSNLGVERDDIDEALRSRKNK